MVETVPEHPHAKFLQQTPTLGMFVSCDEKGNVLEEPTRSYSGFTHEQDILTKHYWDEVKKYQQAEQRVIFEGWGISEKSERCIWIYKGSTDNEIKFDLLKKEVIYKSKLMKTIEDLVPYNLILK